MDISIRLQLSKVFSTLIHSLLMNMFNRLHLHSEPLQHSWVHGLITALLIKEVKGKLEVCTVLQKVIVATAVMVVLEFVVG